MSKIYVQPSNYQRFDEFLEYAKEHGYNMEVASFAYSDVLDTNWQALLEDHQQKLQGFKGIVSLHGAFLDLIIHSRDEKVKEVARKRIYHNMEIAKNLDAQYVIFHGNFNPLITHESYKQNWIEQNAQFWSEVLDRYEGTVLMENVWEPAPDIFRKLLDEVESPRVKICFDTGHAHIFSRVPFEEWISVLREDICYIHVNDNNGDTDDELVPGEGSINWQKFSDVIKKYQITPGVVFEVGTLEKTAKSIEYFKGKSIYPFCRN
ncbi:MAG: sugar phosphate isomerase/epimerase [Theionarchaea archaeon]|nr:sugar phosphate isomerase/epimerase [Theionarchaea archaeon]